jgi:hypothetical protein
MKTKAKILNRFVLINSKQTIFEISLRNLIIFQQHNKPFPYIKIYKIDGRVEIEMLTRKETIRK